MEENELTPLKTSDLIWQDTQHQTLLDLIERIDSPDVDVSIFHRLHEHAETHFSMEEEYMRQLGYPYIEEHIEAHDKFRAELQTMMLEFVDYDRTFRRALSEFLAEWLKGHFLGIDKKLEDFILNSDSK